jgi:hypothetical protein
MVPFPFILTMKTHYNFWSWNSKVWGFLSLYLSPGVLTLTMFSLSLQQFDNYFRFSSPGLVPVEISACCKLQFSVFNFWISNLSWKLPFLKDPKRVLIFQFAQLFVKMESWLLSPFHVGWKLVVLPLFFVLCLFCA